MRRFFETVASRVKHLYDIANRDVEAWLKSVMSPLETQVREHQMQLRRRLESIKRIHRASDELEERVAELGAQREALEAQLRALDAKVAAIDAIARNDELPFAANAA
jgi:phage shock protein A